MGLPLCRYKVYARSFSDGYHRLDRCNAKVTGHCPGHERASTVQYLAVLLQDLLPISSGIGKVCWGGHPLASPVLHASAQLRHCTSFSGGSNVLHPSRWCVLWSTGHRHITAS